MTVQEINNLKIFLDRVNLTGKEVMAYNLILKAIHEAEPIEESEFIEEVGE